MFTSNNRLINEMLVSQGKCSHGEPLSVFGDLMYLKASKEDTNCAFTIMEDIIPAHGGPPLHLHHREDEAFFVLEGDYIFEVDGRPIAAHPGDFLWTPRGIRHTFQNQSSSPGRLLITIMAGGAEEFFPGTRRASPTAQSREVSPALPQVRPGIPRAAHVGAVKETRAKNNTDWHFQP
jgi:quercetin dioxygenase-like cupin family protein